MGAIYHLLELAPWNLLTNSMHQNVEGVVRMFGGPTERNISDNKLIVIYIVDMVVRHAV